MVKNLLKLRFIDPLTEFIHDARAIGMILFSSTIVSLLLANIDKVSKGYKKIWSLGFDGTSDPHFSIGIFHFPNTPLACINDFLMAFFFLLAGMEIKRELVQGELSSFKKSVLPFAAAIGGMLVPAIIFFLINRGSTSIRGWAIPMATDIAFALGIASLLGKRVPAPLKIFLIALAIIDDLGAILIIALFYGGKIQLAYLLVSCLIIGLLFLIDKRKIKFGLLQVVLGVFLWYCMFNSGIHATIAGVLFSLFIPKKLLNSLEQKFHIPVYFIIMPIFALANTAIQFPANTWQLLSGGLSWGIMIALCIGKPLGICGISYLLVKGKFAELPTGIRWNKMIGAGLLAGVGFTMSLFISSLAFDEIVLQDISKISVLFASLLAMLAGYLWLKFVD